jgi:hypothetical protein
MRKQTLIRLQADEGMLLTDGKHFVKFVQLTPEDSESDWSEVTEAYVKKISAKMTPREFLLALIGKGKTREQIEAVMNSDDRIWAELTGATTILRSNPLLDQLCSQFDLTPADVDEIFGL